MKLRSCQTDVGGVGEALGDTGLLVPANQPVALGKIANRATESHASTTPGDLGKKSRQRALAMFTQKKCIQAHLDTYNQLIRQARIVGLQQDKNNND